MGISKFLSQKAGWAGQMVSLLWVCCGLTLGNALAAETDNTVKVAFMPVQAGFYNVDDFGNYSGYNYDYLLELSAYTGWDYEFILIDEGWNSYSTAKTMLMTGEIDLLGPMFSSDEQAYMYEYGSYHNGISRHSLCTYPSSTLTADNYFLQESLTAALVEDSVSEEAFHSLMNQHGLDSEIVYVSSDSEAQKLLFAGEVDVIMSWDVAASYGSMIPIDTTTPTAFYFVGKAGNTSLISELDRAASLLELAEPSIGSRLRSTYFEYVYEGNMVISSEEEELISEYSSLKVGLLQGLEPYQFVEEDEIGKRGITVEIMEELSDIVGIPFEYVWMESKEQLKEALSSGEIDLCGSFPNDYGLASTFGVTMTRPYLSKGVVLLHHDLEQGEVLSHYYFLTSEVQESTEQDLILSENIEESMKILSENGGISLYCDPNVAQYYIQKLDIDNISSQVVSSLSSPLSIGVAKHLDTGIVALLNRGILHLDENLLDEIIYNSVILEQGISLEMFLEENSGLIICVVFFFLLVIVFALVYHSMKLRDLSRRDGLTKLYNSGYFHQYAQDKSRKLRHGGLILVDIDLFKQVNDTYGHQTGDRVITAVAWNLEKIFGQDNTLARLGGDEFIVFLEHDYDQKTLEEQCCLLQELLKISVEAVPVTLSIGGILFQHSMEYQDLYRCADENLYKVKENGRNNFVISADTVQIGG